MINRNNKIFLLYISFSILAFASSAVAKPPHELRVTPKEQAVFAFFRALNSSPDYDYWIKSKSTYKSLPSKSQERYLLNETLRLGGGFGSFDQDIDLLELKINVSAIYIPAKDGVKPRVLFEFFNNSKNYTPTFNYPYGDEVLSLIINRLELYSDMLLNEKQNAAVLKKIPYQDKFFDAALTIHVRVDKANYKKPIAKDPVVQWLMIGEIAYLKCDVISYETGRKYMLWDYVAPWHKEVFRMKNMTEEEKYPHPFDLFKD